MKRSCYPIYWLRDFPGTSSHKQIILKSQCLPCKRRCTAGICLLTFTRRRYISMLRAWRFLFILLTLLFSFSATAGTAKRRASRARHRILWVGLWVGNSPDQARKLQQPIQHGTELECLWLEDADLHSCRHGFERRELAGATALPFPCSPNSRIPAVSSD